MTISITETPWLDLLMSMIVMVIFNDHGHGHGVIKSTPKALFSAMPVLYVPAVLQTEKHVEPRSYTCPCCKNPLRTNENYIFDVDLRSEDTPAKWVLQGVALECSDAM